LEQGEFGVPCSASVVLWLALAANLATAGASPAAVATDTWPGDYRVVQWTTAEGLPQNTVTDMVFLPNGELWLSTFGGLARFDGHGFKVLDVAGDEGLPANRIVSLVAEGAESFLVLTQQGHLGRVERGRSTLLVPPPLASVEAIALLVDHAGRVYCKSTDGKIWQSDGRHAWQPIPPPPGEPAALFHAFAVDEHGEAWGAWRGQLVRLAGDTAKPIPLPPGDVVVSARSGGGMWLGLQRGIGRVVGERLERLRVEPELDGPVSVIESAGEEALWLAAAGEVSRLARHADGSWRRTPLPLRLPAARSVRSLHQDGAGSLWIGTAGSGLFRVNRVPVRRFAAESGLTDIGALASDRKGGAFASSGCRGLFHLGESGVVRPVRLWDRLGPGPLPPCGTSLAPGPGDRIWARSGSELYQVARTNLDARLVTRALPFEEGPIVAAPDGSAVVVSRSGSVHVISGEGMLLREFRLQAPLISASLGPDGSLWIGGDGEVFRVRSDAVSRFGEAEHVPRGLVRDVVAEPDGTAWVGTYGGGVGRLRGGRVVRLAGEQGLPDNSVSRILDDGRGRLWISTNRGIAAIEKRALEAVADGRARALAPVVLGMERGVAEANFGSPAGFADARGRLWFGTIAGAVSIDAAAFPFNATPPSVRIEEVRADETPLPLGTLVRVPPRTARLRLSFTAFAPLYPERMRFRFRVEGIDPGWVEAGSDRAVEWSPPGPGRHRFVVEARNEDGVWSKAPAAVELDVLPAWWQTTAFRATAVLALALVGAAGVRLRIRAIERRHAERLRALEEQRLAEERMDAMRAQVEHVSRAALAGELSTSLAHEVRQPVAAIVNNAEAGRRNLAHYLQHPSELREIFDDIVTAAMRVSQVLQDLRGFLGSSQPAAAAIDLSALVREMLPLVRRELQGNRVDVELELDAVLPRVEGSRVQLGQLVVNLLVNACEALGERDGERRIVIGTAARNGRVELAVRDNGPGLPASVAARLFEPFVTTKPEGLGMGLAVCRSIAERHGGHLRADTAPEGGLCMTVTLPALEPQVPRP
jgi:signal transduction histidine kinase